MVTAEFCTLQLFFTLWNFIFDTVPDCQIPVGLELLEEYRQRDSSINLFLWLIKLKVLESIFQRILTTEIPAHKL